ncbi:muscarinic acetylcholine receptor M2-like [Paramacrobiotus metropolitanus]|uniref:muscarinic acetylcholine receptor M2-like n=1 Tax=Paramacrobiotus metropolitanus TaxID=2943436 RepID=UPI002446424E|nr:muscarinic acetylcholine receptor M2-like [Paramacrobiotus metropolitanus]
MSIAIQNNSNASNVSLSTGYAYPDPPSLDTLVPLGIILISAIITTVGGNGFIIYAFLRFPHLRTQFNTYIFNLSIADLFVGIIVMPSFFLYNCYGYWPFGEPMCSVWVFTDWFMTFESVMVLAVISVERLWSVTWPVTYKQWHTPGQVRLVIVCTWVFVASIWMPAFFYDRFNHDNVVEDCAWDPAKNYAGGFYIGVLGYLAPFITMVVSYTIVGFKMRKRFRKTRATKGAPIQTEGSSIQPRYKGISPISHVGVTEKSIINSTTLTAGGDEKQLGNRPAKINHTANREKSALLTLGAIVVAFSICWIPFYVYFFVTLFNWGTLPTWFLTMTYWLAYLNSAVNPVLYTALHDDFRQKLVDLFRCCRKY